MNQFEGPEQFISANSCVAIVTLGILILASFLGIYFAAFDVPGGNARIETQMRSASLSRGGSGNFLLSGSVQNTGTEPVSLGAQFQGQSFLISNATFSPPVIASEEIGTYASDIEHVGRFDGSSGSVRVPNSSSLNSSTFSIEFGFQYSSHNPDNQLIIGKGAAGGNSWYFFSYRSLNVFNDFVVYVSGTRYDQELGDIFAVDTWYDIALTLNGTTISAYVNGKLTQSWERSITFSGNNDDLLIGTCVCGGYYFNGSMAFVRQYGRAITAQDVAWNFLNPSRPVGSALLMWLPFDTETSGIIEDRSASGNIGIVVGGVELAPPVISGRMYVVTIVASTSSGIHYSISVQVLAAG